MKKVLSFLFLALFISGCGTTSLQTTKYSAGSMLFSTKYVVGGKEYWGFGYSNLSMDDAIQKSLDQCTARNYNSIDHDAKVNGQACYVTMYNWEGRASRENPVAIQNYKIFAKALEKQKVEEANKKIIENQQAQIDQEEKRINTCLDYGFQKGTDGYGNCLLELMDLEFKYAQLELQRLQIESQLEQAKLNNQTAKTQSLNNEQLLKQQEQLIEMQKTRNALEIMRQSSKLLEQPKKSIDTLNCTFIYNTISCN